MQNNIKINFAYKYLLMIVQDQFEIKQKTTLKTLDAFL